MLTSWRGGASRLPTVGASIASASAAQPPATRCAPSAARVAEARSLPAWRSGVACSARLAATAAQHCARRAQLLASKASLLPSRHWTCLSSRPALPTSSEWRPLWRLPPVAWRRGIGRWRCCRMPRRASGSGGARRGEPCHTSRRVDASLNITAFFHTAALGMRTTVSCLPTVQRQQQRCQLEMGPAAGERGCTLGCRCVCLDVAQVRICG